MKKMFNEGNQIHNFMSSYGSYGSGSGSTTLSGGHEFESPVRQEFGALTKKWEDPWGQVFLQNPFKMQIQLELETFFLADPEDP